MKKITILLFLFSILFTGIYTFSQTPPYLQIHHIGGGYGDATLIIAVDKPKTGTKTWDTCVVLIDGQSSAGVGEEVWRYVKDTVHALFPFRKIIDYIVVSHMHTDHFLGVQPIIENAITDSWAVGYIGLPSLINDNPNGVDDDCYAETSSTSYTKKASDFRSFISTCGYPNGIIEIKSDLFHWKNFSNMTLECIVAGGATIDPADSSVYSFLRNGKVKNENDLSYGWLLTFQGFHYVSLGDLGGPGSSAYSDGETPVTEYLVGRFYGTGYHLCANKISHHGSAKSTYTDFVTYNNPSLAVIPGALKVFNGTALPTQDAITRLLNNANGTNNNVLNTSTATSIVYTFIPSNPSVQSSYWTSGRLQYYQDVILKIEAVDQNEYVENERTFTIICVPKDSDFSYTNPSLPARTKGVFLCDKFHEWDD